MTVPTPASQILVVDDVLFDEHRSRGYHPERPERLAAARAAVERCVSEGLTTRRITARDATDEELTAVHSPGYLENLAKLAGHHAALDPDTYLAPNSVAAARRAAGASAALVDALLDLPADGCPPPALALLRPPGHHAKRERGMGFCILNNVAVAAARALARGLSRVAIIDWDVHHGNGTQDIFWNDPRVLYVSLHQFPYYPGTGAVGETGEGDGRGYTVNVPLSAGAGDAVYEAAFTRIVLPLLESYAPELLLVSAGFDAHERDPLADMRVSDAGYSAMSTLVSRAAQGSAGGKLAFFLEGGYDLAALDSSLAATLRAAVDTASGPQGRSAAPMSYRHEDELNRARKTAAERWRGL
ncbi:histone deacetylase [Polyangium aurulentum]|uniref:histone deacetylase family protein n=1 Tax=Polyangium aurulentum TaxID=2567896 RepID=UPI0010AE5E9F|nr:histone deacetylase [Polyangium aurulentum]UQA59732.1 histone deacetylase [Polyangium aurulentum]